MNAPTEGWIEPFFPKHVDNTARSTFRSCPQKWIYQTVRHLAPKTPSEHLHAGGAFAFGIEHARRAFFEQGLPPVEAMQVGSLKLVEFYGDFEAPEGSNKTKDRMLEAYFSYMLEYPLDSAPVKPFKFEDDLYGIEFRFGVPLPFQHPETGDPLLYAGRFDMLAEFSGSLFAVDEKTASQLGPSWMKQWETDSQFTGYCWAAGVYGKKVAGAIIRGVGILKNSISHAQAIIYRPEWKINRWLANLYHDIAGMLHTYEAFKKNEFIPMALDKSTCSNYGGCTFRSLCESPDPEAWIPIHFTTRVWDPLHKGA